MNKMTETIVQFKVSDTSSKNAWGDLVTGVSNAFPLGAKRRDSDITDYLREFEDEFMESYHSSDPAAKKKNGTWKYSIYLPNAYRSAKSVICRAHNKGVYILDNGVARGKTAVERDIQKAAVQYVDLEIVKHIKALKRYEALGFGGDVLAQINNYWPMRS